MLTLTGSDAITQAMRLAIDRDLLPTELGSAELQEITQRMKERVFFSARTSNLWYLDRLKALVERYVKGEGKDNDLAQLRVEARRLLAQAGYTPEAGFPGDDALGIPPATAGSLRDLASEKRLNLIYDTQAQLMRGQGLKLRGAKRADRYPAWELVRVAKFNSEHQREWRKRWDIASDNVDGLGTLNLKLETGITRMIALKSSPIWLALGSSALFPDAVNADHPPFAFNSGMGWRELPLEEAEEFSLAASSNQQPASSLKPPRVLPPADAAKLARFQRIQAKFDANERRRAAAA